MSDDLGVLDRYLTIWIGLTMALGVGVGRFVPGIAELLNAITWQGTSLPIALGYLTQKVAFSTVGRDAYYRRFVPRIDPFGLLGLLFTIVVMFALKGEYIVANPEQIVLIATPLFVFFVGLWGLAYGASAVLGFEYAESSSVAFTAASNNFELAIAVAVAVFGIGSNVALATVIGPLIEVPVMLALVRVALATRERLWPAEQEVSRVAYSD